MKELNTDPEALCPFLSGGYSTAPSRHLVFTLLRKVYKLVRVVDNAGGWACVGAENIRKISLPSLQFCESKTALKVVLN